MAKRRSKVVSKKSLARPAPRRTARTRIRSFDRRANPPSRPGVVSDSLTRTIRARQLFWNNVMREMLCSLAMMSSQAAAVTPPDRPRQLVPGDVGATPVIPSDESPARLPIFDGRLGVILANGTRVPIANIRAVFALGVTKTARDRWLSETVECTVFEITTPEGEVLTLPLHEIRAFHSLSEDLLKKLEDASRSQGSEDDQEHPFGFAAYTSLSRSRQEPDIPAAGLADSPIYDPGFGE